MGATIRVPYFDVSTVKKVSNGYGVGTVVPKGASLLGEGEFGQAFKITPRQARGLVDHLDTHLRGVWSMPRGTGHIVLKVLKIAGGDVHKALTNGLRELYIQWHLSTAPAKTVHGNVFDVKRYVPTPYFGGFVRATREFLICMKMQPGTTLLNANKLKNKNQYLEIERAYISMLLNNVLYVDFHEANIMVTDDGDVYVIDFGGALLLSDSFKTKKETEQFRRRLRQFLRYWPNHVTYFSQRKHINEQLMANNGQRAKIEKTLSIFSKAASGTLSNVRGMINAKRRHINVPNIVGRNKNIVYK